MKTIFLCLLLTLFNNAYSQHVPCNLYGTSVSKDSIINQFYHQSVLKELLIRNILVNDEDVINTVKILNYINFNLIEEYKISSAQTFYFYNISFDSVFIKELSEIRKQNRKYGYVKSSILEWIHNHGPFVVLIHDSYNTVCIYRLKGFYYNDATLLEKDWMEGSIRYIRFRKRFNKYF